MNRLGIISLSTIFALQALCAVFFVTEFASEIFGLRQWALSWFWREILQIAATFGLLTGTATSIFLLRRILAREDEVETQLKAASGEFFSVMDDRFNDWSLTKSEREVALFALRGMGNAEIASLREKSEATIKSQLNSIFRKAQVSNRAELMSEFVELLIEEPMDRSLKR